jgi:hypothetical protein
MRIAANSVAVRVIFWRNSVFIVGDTLSGEKQFSAALPS